MQARRHDTQQSFAAEFESFGYGCGAPRWLLRAEGQISIVPPLPDLLVHDEETL